MERKRKEEEEEEGEGDEVNRFSCFHLVSTPTDCCSFFRTACRRNVHLDF